MKFPPTLLLLAAASRLCAADFPAPYNSEPGNPSPIPAAEALAKITLPLGLQATLFASEPEGQNPIAMCFDARRRLWVAENYTYAERALRLEPARPHPDFRRHGWRWPRGFPPRFHG